MHLADVNFHIRADIYKTVATAMPLNPESPTSCSSTRP